MTAAERFLKSSDPEVLCISGPWSAGKTFAWKKAFDEVVAAREFAMRPDWCRSWSGGGMVTDRAFQKQRRSRKPAPAVELAAIPKGR